MALRKKIYIFIVMTFVIVTTFSYTLTTTILYNQNKEVEEVEITTNMESVRNIILHEIIQINTICSGWANRDDTYDFLNGLDDEYIRSNLLPNTFETLNLNFILYFDSSGEMVYGKGYDFSQKVETAVQTGLAPHLTAEGLLVHNSGIQDSVSGIVLTASGAAIVVSQPILTSTGEGPARGTLVMGRFVNPPVYDQISQILSIPLEIVRYDDPTLPNIFQEAQDEITVSSPVFITLQERNKIGSGIIIINDIYGQQALLIKGEFILSHLSATRLFGNQLLIGLILLGLLTSTLIIIALTRWQIVPLSLLATRIRDINPRDSSLGRLEVTGNDEIAHVVNRINEMLEILEKDRKQRIEFTKLLAHELKNALTPLLAGSEILSQQLHEEPFRSLAMNIQRGAIQMQLRIREMLDTAKIEMGILIIQQVSVDPHKFLSIMSETIKPLATSRKQSVLLELPRFLPKVWADPDRMEQIGANFLVHASKFTPGGGTITIGTEVHRPYLLVFVRDTGTGMSQEKVDNLFDSTREQKNLDNPMSGLGLGLPLCKNLVESQGGLIWAESQKHKGSTFYFTIPLTSSKLEKGNRRSRSK